MCLTRRAALLSLALVCAGCMTQEPIVENLEALRAQLGFPGATFAVKQGDQPIQSFAVGLADTEGVLPMTTQTRMLSGSTGKTFVAALALQLIAEGKLELDKPIDPWLTDASWYPALPHKNQITLRMLLSHTSGIADHIYSAGYATAVGEQMTAMQQGTDVETYIRPHRLV